MPSNSLEQEAMERVRRMYASFDSRAPRHDASPDAKTETTPRPTVSDSEQSTKEKADQPVHDLKQLQMPNSLLDVFLKDQDQSLILLLLVLLMKDGADMNLMLALVYLLL